MADLNMNIEMPPPNAERLQRLDRTNMEDAFIHLFAIHERHRHGAIYSCQTCPLCDQAICAYSTLVAMCKATGVNIEEIKKLMAHTGTGGKPWMKNSKHSSP